MSERCETCRFWIKTPNLTVAEVDCLEFCKRRPPRIFANVYDDVEEGIVTQRGHQVGSWPLSHKLAWCGEWEALGPPVTVWSLAGLYGNFGDHGLTGRARKVLIRLTGEIETASLGDLTLSNLLKVNGCGPCTAKEILAWRDSLLAKE